MAQPKMLTAVNQDGSVCRLTLVNAEGGGQVIDIGIEEVEELLVALSTSAREMHKRAREAAFNKAREKLSS